jgi:error-prone DNA polymerase
MPDHPAPSPPPADAPPQRGTSRAPVAYAELAVTSNFTFLTGASHPEELVAHASRLGHTVAAIADTNSLAGVVRAHVAAQEHGIPLALGCRLRFADPPGLEVLVFPTCRASYGRLCRLLTLGKRRAAKGACHITLDDLPDHSPGLLAVLCPPPRIDSTWASAITRVRHALPPDALSLGIARSYAHDDHARIRALQHLAHEHRLPLAAINDVLYHTPARRPLQDVLTCIRHGCTIDSAGQRLAPNAERHLKPPDEMLRLFPALPEAIRRSAWIGQTAAAGFSLDLLRYEYPLEIVPHGQTPIGHLTALAWAGAQGRYPQGVPSRVRDQIRYELALIDELAFAPYFLTCHDIVRFARSRAILCQGRGAAANSAVCYCLGITSVDPDRIDVLFERFISRERNEPPDIDIDFEHERREEVIQYIYGRYGRARAALTAESITYRGRSAVREVGKAMGLSIDCVDRLAGSLEWWDAGGVNPDRLRAMGFNPSDPTLRMVVSLTAGIIGFPRHRSQHVGGFVISRGDLCESVPIENAAMPDRTVIEWDKDDIDALGMLKIDILGLGMLTCIRKSFQLIEHRRPLTLATVPAEDPAVYDMICAADTVGVFQIESRAQMSMLPRLRPRCFYDLVIEVAIVRPGPIQGDMVHPYLRRRTGKERISYPHPDVERVLSKTLGVPLFQEQVMQLAITAAGFSPGQADQLRRAMAAWKRKSNDIHRLGESLISGMLARGYPGSFAQSCFEQIKGFSEYGFPESHAASFALLVYVSAWLKRHEPAAFTASLLNSQPMGFYGPAQLVRDAKEHGVHVLPVDVNVSDWDCTLEQGPGGAPALRLGMRMVKGLPQADAQRTLAARTRPFTSIASLHRAAGISPGSLRCLARADAFGSMGLDRQGALWHIRALGNDSLPLFDAIDDHTTHQDAKATPSFLPACTLGQRVRHDYDAVGLSLTAHPVSLIRDRLAAMGAAPTSTLKDPIAMPRGAHAAFAGIVTCRQRPATASGVVFITLEDESGYANLIVRPRVYEACRGAARHSTMILARGRVERQGEVVHLLVASIRSIDHFSDGPNPRSRDFR